MTDQPPQPPDGSAPPPVPPSPPPADSGSYAAPPPAAPAGPPAPYGSPPAYGAVQGSYAPAPPVAGAEPVPGTLPYVERYFGPVATFGVRAYAYVIDVLLTLIGLVPFFLGLVVLIASLPTETGGLNADGTTELVGGSAGGIVTGSLLMLLGGLLSFGIWLWNRVFRMGRTGQSVGKRVVGLRLINPVTGEPIGAGRAFLREVVYGVVNQVFYLAFLWMLWDPNRQTLGDLAVKSSVITVPKA